MNLKAAVESVHFPLWRYNPDAEGKKLTLDSADKSDTVSFAANAVSKELGENRAGPCGRLRRCFATFPSKQSFFGASQEARQEDRPGQGDGDAQGRTTLATCFASGLRPVDMRKASSRTTRSSRNSRKCKAGRARCPHRVAIKTQGAAVFAVPAFYGITRVCHFAD